MSLGLDLSGVTATGGPVPAGTYTVVVDKAEVAPTKSGTGQVIKVQLKIRDGDHAGRVIFDSFNIKNSNPQAVQIGLGQLKRMMNAFGHANPNQLHSCTELLGLKGQVVVRVDEQAGFDPQARVKRYLPLAGEAAASAEGGASPAPKDPFS